MDLVQAGNPWRESLTTDYNPDGTVLDLKDGKGNAILSYGHDSLARVGVNLGEGVATPEQDDWQGNMRTAGAS